MKFFEWSCAMKREREERRGKQLAQEDEDENDEE